MISLSKLIRYWGLPLVLAMSAGVGYGQNSPVIPGFDRLHSAEGVSEAAKGELLLGELGCVQCHQASETVQSRLSSPQAPDLSKVGSRVTPQWLSNYLNDPHGVKPGSKMPDIFHASDPQAKAGAIRFLVDFLASQDGPIQPSKLGGTENTAARGKQLFNTVGCAACHAPEGVDGIQTPVVPLPDMAAKTTVDQLMAFLLNPSEHRPSGRMPNLGLDEDEARAISVYLLKDQLTANEEAGGKTASVEGISYEFYKIGGLSKLPDFKELEPVVKGITKSFSHNVEGKDTTSNYAIRFTADINAPSDGNYRFWTASDDGSKLWINGNEVVDNDGNHGIQVRDGRVRLTKGLHSIEVQYYQGGGGDGLQVQWAGPGIKRGEIPVENLTSSSGKEMVPTTWTDHQVIERNATVGSRMFAAMRCVNCHTMPNMRAVSPAPAFASLNVSNDAGCLGENLSRRAPNYHLSAAQKKSLKSAVSALQAKAEAPSHEEIVNRSLAANNCYACHKRGDIGGPDEARRPFFTSTVEIDLGEEGIIPPTLNGVGSKFKPSALKRIVTKGELHVRHYMATRMPKFDESAVGAFLDSIHHVDTMQNLEVEPPFTKERIEAGRKFTGTTGVACITCHGVAGHPGLGINGIDMTSVYDRLQPKWFEKFLLDPASFNPGTRMPGFWPGGQSAFPDVLGGDSTAQVQAIWSYLSLGSTMPLPKGIVPAGSVGMELVPAQTPIVHRTFMKDVGPRSILTGYPEKLNVAFDANNVRLAKAWRGRFFDGSGVASGRTDKFLDPLGSDVFDLPSGPAVALLDDASAPWPAAEKLTRDVGGKFRGYSLDDQLRPIFKYSLNGLNIEEMPSPVLEPGGPSLTRYFSISGEVPDGKSAFILLAQGSEIKKKGEEFMVDDKVKVSVTGKGYKNLSVRKDGDHAQLIANIAPGAEISINTQW